MGPWKVIETVPMIGTEEDNTSLRKVTDGEWTEERVGGTTHWGGAATRGPISTTRACAQVTGEVAGLSMLSVGDWRADGEGK